MRGRMSFLMKGIYFIIILVVISIVINQIVSMNLISFKEWESINLRERSRNILETLSGNKNCLAYEELGSIEGKDVLLSSHRIIDVNKLERFSSDFTDLQPDCARDFNFGYRVKVKTFPVDLSTSAPEPIEIPETVFEDVLNETDGKNVVFLADVTGSMKHGAGECSDYSPENTKLCCIKKFLTGFIDEMRSGSNISLIEYSSRDIKEIFDFTTLNDTNRNYLKNKITPLDASGGTPMCEALKTGFEKAKEKLDGEKPKIVLLTDGCENSGCKCGPPSSTVEVAEDYAGTGISVYTIGFGAGPDTGYCNYPICLGPLNDTAEATNGEFFKAITCEELVGPPEIPEAIKVEMGVDIWTFGDGEFSEDKALEEKISVSIPVVVSYDQSTFLPGMMSITLVNGQLEKLTGFIEETCFTEKDSVLNLYLNYPVRREENKICMEFESGKKCQKLACKKTIEFHEIERPGNYRFYSRHEDEILKILV